jgi:hypothetical protein
MQPIIAAAGELTSGDFDDNLNFSYFLEYHEQTQGQDQYQQLPALVFSDRVTLRITDRQGTGFSNALVHISSHRTERVIIESYAGTDGVFRFFPTQDGAGTETRFDVVVSSPDAQMVSASFLLDLDDLPEDRTVGVTLNIVQRQLPDALDLMIVLDTTGSMRDELSFLKYEFASIVQEIAQRYPDVNIRYGLIVYRDIGDEYVTREYPFTESLETMERQLREQEARGGGDYPEAMDQAVAQAVAAPWRDGNTVRLLFLVADAPPHAERLQATIDQVMLARERGIHIHPLAASGVRETAEYIMRTSAVLIHGRYIFLTDDSGIGNPHAEPHIPGYVVTTLTSTFIRVVSSELSGERVEPTENEIIRVTGRIENGIVPPRDRPVDEGDPRDGGDDDDPRDWIDDDDATHNGTDIIYGDGTPEDPGYGGPDHLPGSGGSTWGLKSGGVSSSDYSDAVPYGFPGVVPMCDIYAGVASSEDEMEFPTFHSSDDPMPADGDHTDRRDSMSHAPDGKESVRRPFPIHDPHLSPGGGADAHDPGSILSPDPSTDDAEGDGERSSEGLPDVSASPRGIAVGPMGTLSGSTLIITTTIIAAIGYLLKRRGSR